MAVRSKEDITALKCLAILSVVYALMSYATYTIIHMNHVQPLGLNAPLHQFSEARAVGHIRKLSVDIPGRQVFFGSTCVLSRFIYLFIWVSWEFCSELILGFVCFCVARAAGVGGGGSVYKGGAPGVGGSRWIAVEVVFLFDVHVLC